jgi:tRNA/rRNA methyltransferase
LKKENVVFILDGSQLASNVAQAGRAMANFGFHQLRLINPLNLPSAERMARGGAQVVRDAAIYTDLNAALADLSWVVGTTGKGNIDLEELLRPEAAVAELAGLASSGKVGIVFGCEHHGLTNNQLRTMDRLAHVPTQPDCASINLAQSVALFAWELEKVNVGAPKDLDFGIPSHEKKQQLFIKMDRLFKSTGVLDDGRKRSLQDGLRMFFNRQPLNSKDLGFLLRTFNLFQKHLTDVNKPKD